MDVSHVARQRFDTTWNQTVRKVWSNSHQTHLVGLNSGSHDMDLIYRRFCEMVFFK